MKRGVIIALTLVVLAGAGLYFLPHPETTVFESDHIGLRFEYPDRYVATTTHVDDGEQKWHAVVLMPAGYVPPEGGEGPPVISVQDIPNPEGLGLQQWLQSDAHSNWKMIVDERASTSTVVDGVPAIWYHYSGLYEVDSVAVAHNGKIYLFTVDWLTPADQIRTDFNNLIKKVQFI